MESKDPQENPGAYAHVGVGVEVSTGPGRAGPGSVKAGPAGLSGRSGPGLGRTRAGPGRAQVKRNGVRPGPPVRAY